MSGRMPAAFCVYPTVHIKSERKCICLYIQNVLRAAVVKMCIPYHTHLFIKKVYTLLYVQKRTALSIFQLPAAMCTHMHMHFISKKCTPTIHTNLPAAVRKRRQKHSFAGRLMTATQLRSARPLPLHCFLLFHAHALHTICRPYPACPRPGRRRHNSLLPLPPPPPPPIIPPHSTFNTPPSHNIPPSHPIHHTSLNHPLPPLPPVNTPPHTHPPP